MKSKIILVCKTNGEECEEKGYEVKIGSETHNTCCQKGFEKTLNQFLDYESRERKRDCADLDNSDKNIC